MDKELLHETIEELNAIADTLYKGNVENGIAAMSSVVPKITILSSGINDESFQNRLINDALLPAMEAMNNKDSVALADIITYEIVKLFELL